MAMTPTQATLDAEQMKQHAQSLIDRNLWPREQLVAFQQDRLRNVLQRAAKSSPYYRETIGHLVEHGTPFSELPILTKRIVMANFDRILTDVRLSRLAIEKHLDSSNAGDLLLGEYLAAATGGTTGERGAFLYNGDAWLSVMANIVRFQNFLGVVSTTRTLGIGAPSPIHLSNRFYAELRVGRPDAPALDVTMPISTVVDALNTYQPEIITTYPSFIRTLAEEQMMGRLRISPKYIRSGAETLTNAVKGLAEKAWGIPVVNGYACTEVGAMAQECRHLNGLHLAEDLSVFEVVDENNRPVNAGTKGAKLLVTTLTNPTLPLIRYEITDLITLADGPCACGMPYARVAEIEGRREEILSFPKKGGGTVTVHAIRLHSPMIGTAGVRQFQFSQLPYGIEVTIAVSSEFRSETVRTDVEHSLRTALDEFGAAPCDVRVKIVDSIRRVGMAAKEKLVAK